MIFWQFNSQLHITVGNFSTTKYEKQLIITAYNDTEKTFKF